MTIHCPRPISVLRFNSTIVRYVPEFSIPALQYHRHPFSVEDAPNVILETIKRGEKDFDSCDVQEATTSANDCCTGSTRVNSRATIVLRLFEAYGGHARPTVKIQSLEGLDLKCVCRVNVLEDKIEQLEVLRDGDELTVGLGMRGFEIVTLMLCYESGEQTTGEKESWEEV